MICPNCGKDNNEVTKTGATGSVVRRRRCCLNCGEAFFTTERYVDEKVVSINKVRKIALAKQNSVREALTVPQLKNRNRPVWIDTLGWAIVSDYEGGDFYVYSANGGQWLKGSDCRRKWFAYEDAREV